MQLFLCAVKLLRSWKL